MAEAEFHNLTAVVTLISKSLSLRVPNDCVNSCNLLPDAIGLLDAVYQFPPPLWPVGNDAVTPKPKPAIGHLTDPEKLEYVHPTPFTVCGSSKYWPVPFSQEPDTT